MPDDNPVENLIEDLIRDYYDSSPGGQCCVRTSRADGDFIHCH